MPRPREFDPDQALHDAMCQFWQTGFYNTSVRDLATATGVNHYGLYQVFGSKRGLFFASLDRYQDTVTRRLTDMIKSCDPTVTGLRALFDEVITFFSGSCGGLGCLFCNTAVELAPHDTQAAERVRKHIQVIRRAFRHLLDRFELCHAHGGQSSRARHAGYLADTVYTVGLLKRAGHTDRYIRSHIESALGVLR